MISKMTQANNNLFKSSQPPVDEIQILLEASQKVLVLSHIDPDGDSLGTQLAVAAYLKEIGKDVILMRDSDIPLKYQFLESVLEISHSNDFDDSLECDTAILLECPNLSRAGKGSRFINEKTVVINIDHHRDNEILGNLNWVNSEASSVGEMIYEYFEKVDYKISKAVAEQLYVAILTDTGRFRYRSTLPRTLEIAAKLVEAGADPQKTCDLIYYSMQPSTMILIGKVLNGIKFYHDRQICVLELTDEMLEQAGADKSESDGLVDFTLYNQGVECGALLKENGHGSTKVSFRSKDGINVSEIASIFGGGGHFNAAGCLVPMGLNETHKEIVKLLEEAMDKK